jgi:glutamate transport system permease protein
MAGASHALGDYTDNFVHGILLTIEISAGAYAIALVVGVLIAVLRVSPVLPMRGFGTAYVEVLRNTPLLILIFIVFFGLPEVGVKFGLVTSGVLALGFYEAAFICESVRSGIFTVPVGQAEAARAVGLPGRQVLTTVVLPQALRTVVQPLGSLFQTLILNSSLVAAIGVTDITGTARHVEGFVVQPIPLFVGAGVAYLVLTLLVGQLTGLIERRVAVLR